MAAATQRPIVVRPPKTEGLAFLVHHLEIAFDAQRAVVAQL